MGLLKKAFHTLSNASKLALTNLQKPAKISVKEASDFANKAVRSYVTLTLMPFLHCIRGLLVPRKASLPSHTPVVYNFLESRMEEDEGYGEFCTIQVCAIRINGVRHWGGKFGVTAKKEVLKIGKYCGNEGFGYFFLVIYWNWIKLLLGGIMNGF